jgi:hypothetical protein
MAHAYNFRTQSAVESAPKPKVGGSKKLRYLKVEPGTAGGHVVTHAHEYGGPGPEHPDETFPFGAGQGAEVMAHIAKAMGIKHALSAPKPPAPPAAGKNALE